MEEKEVQWDEQDLGYDDEPRLKRSRVGEGDVLKQFEAFQDRKAEISLHKHRLLVLSFVLNCISLFILSHCVSLVCLL